MKDFTKQWKELAHHKQLECAQFIQRCILKAIKAKTPQTLAERKSLLYVFIQQQFSPITNKGHLQANRNRPYHKLESNLWRCRFDEKMPGLLSCLETNEDCDNYRALHEELRKRDTGDELKKPYSYFFVRTDLSAAQVAVQGIHVGIDLGRKLQNTDMNLDNLHVVLCGVTKDQLSEASQRCKEYGVDCIDFKEPDIGNEVTAIATYPIPNNRRQFLRGYKLIEFPQKNQ